MADNTATNFLDMFSFRDAAGEWQTEPAAPFVAFMGPHLGEPPFTSDDPAALLAEALRLHAMWSDAEMRKRVEAGV